MNMKIIEMPVMLTAYEYESLKALYKTDIAIRCFLHRKIESMIASEMIEVERDLEAAGINLDEEIA